MKCTKCGYDYNDKITTCPNCGLRRNDVSFKKIEKKTSNNKQEENSSFSIIIILMILFIILSVVYIYKSKNEKDNYEEEYSLIERRIMDFKEKGYSFNDLNGNVSDLDRSSLVSNNYNLASSNNEYKSNTCNKFSKKLSYKIIDGLIYVNYDGYEEAISNITNVKSVIDFNNKTCECSDYNALILLNDVSVYYLSFDNLSSVNDSLVYSIVTGFEKLELETPIMDIGYTSFLEGNYSCKDNTLLLIDTYDVKYILSNDKLIESEATYAYKIYNVNEEKNYSLFINPDRTMQVGLTNNEEALYLVNKDGEKIRYYGILSNLDKMEELVLGVDGYLYNANYSLENSMVCEKERDMKVNSVGYFYDKNEKISKYVIIYEDGSSREYNGNYESRGLFTFK